MSRFWGGDVFVNSLHEVKDAFAAWAVVLAAAALAGFVGDRVARAGRGARANVEPGSLEAHFLELLAAAALRWVFRVELARAAFLAGADERVGTLGLEDMAPGQRLPALALPRLDGGGRAGCDLPTAHREAQCCQPL
jgi:hypothetical protein